MMMMDLWNIFLLVSLVHTVHAFDCDMNCTDKPVFTPSRLVVKHGDPTSATCSVCQSGCDRTTFGLEKAVGNTSTTGTTIKWTVDRLTEWDTLTTCYYNANNSDTQCCTTLPLIVYKPPDSVSISISDHSGLMLEGRQYTLLCEVRNAAPIQNLSVTFYRGNTPLGRRGSVNSAGKKPASETYAWSFNASKEDDGAQYWCEAELELGPAGPQPPPMMKSQKINTTVHYKPQLHLSKTSITLTEGNLLQLNCSAVGNPKPSITWIRNNSDNINGSILKIVSVATADKGEYICSAHNSVATVNVSVTIEVHVNYMPYIIAGVALLIVVVVILSLLGYCHYYRNYRRGQYNLKDVFRLHQQLIPEPIA